MLDFKVHASIFLEPNAVTRTDYILEYQKQQRVDKLKYEAPSARDQVPRFGAF